MYYRLEIEEEQARKLRQAAEKNRQLDAIAAEEKSKLHDAEVKRMFVELQASQTISNISTDDITALAIIPVVETAVPQHSIKVMVGGIEKSVAEITPQDMELMTSEEAAAFDEVLRNGN